MEESQREAMYNGWKNSKTWLKVTKTVDDEKATCSCIYKNKYYKQEFYQKDCVGSTKPFSIAFDRLLCEMKKLDKNIELQYPI